MAFDTSYILNEKLPVELQGKDARNQLEKLATTYQKDDNGLGLLRVFLESTLSADNDEVSLGGGLAHSLARKPSAQITATQSNRTILGKNDPNYKSTTLFDITGHCIVQSLQIVTFGDVPNLALNSYALGGTTVPVSMMTDFNYLSGPMALQSYGADTIKKFSHPLISSKEIDGTAKIWEFTNKKDLVFPHGFTITANNSLTTTYSVNGQIIYLQVP